MVLTLKAPPFYSEETAQPNLRTDRNLTLSHEAPYIIMRVLAGDVSAFNELVVSYQRLAYSIAYRILQSEDAAADAVQESFMKAFRALPTFRGENFKSWLTRIVINTCYDRLRGHDHRSTIALDDLLQIEEGNVDLVAATESPEAYVQRSEVRQWLEHGLHALPAEQRVVVLLYDVHGYSYDEVAEITGAPLGTVKSRLNRGRLRLRDFLLKHDVLPADLEVAHSPSRREPLYTGNRI